MLAAMPFTLIGIAGEDDLDAPHLLPPTAPETKTDGPNTIKKDHHNSGQARSTQQASVDRRAKAGSISSRLMLDPEASAALREQLTSELEKINSEEEAANWAHRVMGAKNSLAAVDAEYVELAFQKRLVSITAAAAPSIKEAARSVRSPDRSKKRRTSVVDKGVLALPAPRRIRDPEHVKSVPKQPCLVCGRCPVDAHHLRFAQVPALGRKASDEFTVPLCRGHHRDVHRCGDEAAWWNKTGIDPIAAARALWLKTHPLPKIIGQPEFKLQKEPNLESNPP
jgi:hypothetical protein